MEIIAIHAEPGIAWQKQRAPQFQRGLQALGINAIITNSRQRETDKAILLGTSCWRHIEGNGDYLLVDRASYGDPDFVQLGWNGHGRRGDHCVPKDPDPWRWHLQTGQFTLFDWEKSGTRNVLCGQTDLWTEAYVSLNAWYARVQRDYLVTHFRAHPAGRNPTNLARTNDWSDVGLAITLNSSIGVEAVMKGIPTVTMDTGSMAWDVSSHCLSDRIMPDRRKWLEWLAWTQWNWSEIETGYAIRHLFEDR